MEVIPIDFYQTLITRTGVCIFLCDYKMPLQSKLAPPSSVMIVKTYIFCPKSSNCFNFVTSLHRMISNFKHDRKNFQCAFSAHSLFGCLIFNNLSLTCKTLQYSGLNLVPAGQNCREVANSNMRPQHFMIVSQHKKVLQFLHNISRSSLSYN